MGLDDLRDELLRLAVSLDHLASELKFVLDEASEHVSVSSATPSLVEGVAENARRYVSERFDDRGTVGSSNTPVDQRNPAVEIADDGATDQSRERSRNKGPRTVLLLLSLFMMALSTTHFVDVNEVALDLSGLLANYGTFIAKHGKDKDLKDLDPVRQAASVLRQLRSGKPLVSDSAEREILKTIALWFIGLFISYLPGAKVAYDFGREAIDAISEARELDNEKPIFEILVGILRTWRSK